MKQEYTFIQLKKLGKQFIEGKRKKLVLMGDCATQHLAAAISGMAVANGMPLDVIDTDYDLIDVLTIDDRSELFESSPDYVLIHMCTEKLLEKFRECSDKTRFADEMMAQIEEY